MIPAKQLKVLVVDDSVLITERLSEMVGELGCVSDVFISGDYTGAIKTIIENTPDLVLLDIHLPEKSGIEVLQYARKNYPAVKIIMVTNNAAGYHRELCHELGSHHFIDKSEEFETIPQLIESYAGD